MKSSKKALRKTFVSIRKALSEKRREEGSRHALDYLLKRLAQCPWVLSFASHREEISLWPLNRILAREERLLLPKVYEIALIPYRVKDLEKELAPHPKWAILEPIPALCEKALPEEIDVVIVPGIAFDEKGQRLGYGKGVYDRFLAGLCCPFIGVGFREQRLKKPLPQESHDVALSEIALF